MRQYASKFLFSLLVMTFVLSFNQSVWAGAVSSGQKWVTSWTGSVHGPYPSGNPTAQPNLSLVFPPEAAGARDQSIRLVVRPDIWGKQTRIRLSNAFGTKPVTFDGVFVGLQMSSSAVVSGTNHAVTFSGKDSITINPGESVWSDAVTLGFVKDPADKLLAGRKLAVSFHVVGESGPMTWHAKALTTSYVTAPGAGARGHEVNETAFPFATSSWYFLDAVDMVAPIDTRLIVAFGDSITDGTATTLNGDDRWSDVLSRRLHALYGNKVVVVNAGIGGNRVVGPAEYSPSNPFPGGPAAGQRIERDVLSLSGASAMIWLEGINDFSQKYATGADDVKAEMAATVKRIRVSNPKMKIFGATLTPALGSTVAGHGSSEEDAKRNSLNEFIRTSGIFDGVIDFERAVLDPVTGGLRAEFVPDNTVGGLGDKLHPNRLGYREMGLSIDAEMLLKP